MFDHSVCCEKLAWNAELTGTLKFEWQRWEQGLPKQIAVTRPLADHRDTIQELHGFGESGITQRLVAAKARLVKQGLTIPRLELVSAHMAYVSECEGCPRGNACNRT